MTQHQRNAAGDGEPEAKPPLPWRCGSDRGGKNSSKIASCLSSGCRGRCPTPRCAPLSPCGDSRAAPDRRVVAKCVGEKFCNTRRSKRNIAVDRKAALHHGELDPTGLGQHAEFRLEIVQYIAQGEIELLSALNLPCLEARDVQQIRDEISVAPRASSM